MVGLFRAGVEGQALGRAPHFLSPIIWGVSMVSAVSAVEKASVKRRGRLRGADFQGLAQGFHGDGDAVDFRGVAEVGETVHSLRSGAETAGKLGGTNALAVHFVQQQNLGGEAR